MARHRSNGNRLHRLTLILLSAVVFITASATPSDTSEGVFDPRFRTVKTSVEGAFMLPPVIRLGTEDRISINFDEIGEDNSYLEYRLIHCDADWQPSRLVESEYLDGFNSARIEDFAYSASTFVHYVNYQIFIPNEDMRVIHSGNYLLQVYDPDSPDETLLQTRFQVVEGSVGIAGAATSRTDRGHYSQWQQLAFELDCEGLRNVNPYQDLIVEVTQNQREATRRQIKSPLRVSGNIVTYEHLPDLIFPAGNEYRRFESISNLFPGMHVDSLRFMGTNYHVWLKPDEARAERGYNFDRTQNGRFIVREYNASDSDIGADYITVHFTLDAPELIDADIYVDGEFTHNSYTAANRMTYDRDAHLYRAEIPLKQGNYNYQYVALKRGDRPDSATPAPIEGNKYETDNEYSVAVYYRPPGARADRLVGFTTLHPL